MWYGVLLLRGLKLNVIGCGRDGIEVSLASAYASSQIRSLKVNVCVKEYSSSEYMRAKDLMWGEFFLREECDVCLCCEYMRG